MATRVRELGTGVGNRGETECWARSEKGTRQTGVRLTPMTAQHCGGLASKLRRAKPVPADNLLPAQGQEEVIWAVGLLMSFL